MNNHTQPAVTWAVITPDVKGLYALNESNLLELTRLLDAEDVATTFAAHREAWLDNFKHALTLESQLSEER